MKKIKVGINGFGRIGKTVFRNFLVNYKEHKELEIVGINDLDEVCNLMHMLKYDSTHGVLDFDYIQKDDTVKLTYNNESHFIKVFKEREPAKIDWDSLGVDVVIDCTGIFREKSQLEHHLGGSVKKVILSAPGKNMDKTIVMGVNNHEYDKNKHNIISNASCTTNCLAPIVKAIDEAFTIRHGLMNTVHAYTADQNLIDGPHKDLRRARSAAESIIPTSTGAAVAVGEVLPHMKGKLDGKAMRVPTSNVSIVDVNFVVDKKTTIEEVNKVLNEFSKKHPKILKVDNEPLVSKDYNGSTFSSVVDSLVTKVMNGDMINISSWYDNESGYSNRMLDLVKHIF